MNRSILITLVLLLLAACDKMEITPSQADAFIKFYNTYPVFTGADVKEVPGKGYALIGTVESYDAGSQICLVRTDEFGNLLDSARYYGRSLNDQAYCLQLLEDNGFGILFSSINPQTEYKEVYFMRTDSTGEVLWFRTFSGTGNMEACHFEVSESGSFIMTGYAESARPGLDKDIWLFGIDGNGNNIESWPTPRLIGGTKDDAGTYLQLLSDGKIVITGQTTSYPPGTLTGNAFILQTGPTGLGGILSTVESATDDIGNCIRVIDNSTFILAGTSNNTSSATGHDIILKKVALSHSGLHVQWQRSFGSNGDDYGHRVIMSDNSLYLLTTFASAGINSSITLITTDLNGSNEVYSSFGEGSQLSSSSLDRTSNNGFIIIGTNKHSEIDMSMALIRVRPEGTL
jgi:hypothetical protein